MDKRILKKLISKLLAEGHSKSKVFAKLKEDSSNPKKLASLIATTPDETLCELHNGKNNILITIVFLQGLLGVFLAFIMGMQMGREASLIISAVVIVVTLLFIFGFYKNSYIAYNVFLVLSIVQLPKAFEGFSESPVISIVGAVISLIVIALVWHIKNQLYPDIGFFGLKKSGDDDYIFSD